MYSRCSMKNLGKQIQTPLAKKEKTFYQFFLPFLKSSSNLQHCEKKDERPSLSHQIYNIVKKKMSLLAKVVPKLVTRKEEVLKFLKGLASEQFSGIEVFTDSKHC